MMISLVKFFKRHGNKVAITLGVLLFSVATVMAVRGIRHYRGNPQKLVWQPTADQRDDDSKDLRSIKEKAKASGRYVGTEYPPKLNQFATLDALSARADAIVIAKALSNISQVSQDGKAVTIDYDMRVEHVYKGALKENDTASVSLPGGLARFADGTSAQINVPWFKKMVNGQTYLLFLSKSPASSWVPTGSARGVFQIPTTTDTRKVTSHSLIQGDPMAQYNDMDVNTFLRAVKAAASNK